MASQKTKPGIIRYGIIEGGPVFGSGGWPREAPKPRSSGSSGYRWNRTAKARLMQRRTVPVQYGWLLYIKKTVFQGQFAV